MGGRRLKQYSPKFLTSISLEHQVYEYLRSVSATVRYYILHVVSINGRTTIQHSMTIVKRRKGHIRTCGSIPYHVVNRRTP